MQKLIERLSVSCDPNEQAEILRVLKAANIDTIELERQLLLCNPFIDVVEEDRMPSLERNALAGMLLLRQFVSKIAGRRICVFCMPKSGSSFVQNMIHAALGISFVHLTAYVTYPTCFGNDEREQEMDEFSIIAQILKTNGNFVAQHHTRASRYLINQLQYYNITPVVTVRNVFDCLVSADDMLLNSFKDNAIGPYPMSAHAHPTAYVKLDQESRLTQLAHTLGIWLLNFYITWKRVQSQTRCEPLWLVYENDILGHGLTEKLSRYLQLSPEELARLEAYADNPDKKESRFNKGVAGRGETLPEPLKKMLRNYAALYHGQLTEQDYFLLFENRGQAS